MTTLVTGGNGWVPSHIVRRLAARGEQVVSFDLMEPDHLVLDLLGPLVGRVTFVHGDIADRAALSRACHDHGVDAIVHAAVITPRRDREQREPARIVEVNLTGTVSALEAARGIPGLRRFVYISSGAVWGEAPGAATLDEESPANAVSLYGITKLASERIALRYGDLFGMDVAAARPANVYGPMERITPGYAGATELREMLRIHAAGEEIRVTSLDGPWLDWTYVEDIAEGVERVWAAGNLPHRVYSVTCGRLYSIGDVLRTWASILPDLRYRVVPAGEANYPVAGGPPGPIPSNARLAADLGWVPSTPFADGMRQYLAWVEENGPQ
ncbi:MAG: NAD-dependent epimerase/dehydratase family protein [Chloroflexota bacterium]